MRDDNSIQPLVHNLTNAARLLDKWDGKLREMVNSGVVRGVMICGKLKIPHSELLRLVAEGDGSTTRRGEYAKEHGRPRRKKVELAASDKGNAS